MFYSRKTQVRGSGPLKAHFTGTLSGQGEGRQAPNTRYIAPTPVQTKEGCPGSQPLRDFPSRDPGQDKNLREEGGAAELGPAPRENPTSNTLLTRQAVFSSACGRKLPRGEPGLPEGLTHAQGLSRKTAPPDEAVSYRTTLPAMVPPSANRQQCSPMRRRDPPCVITWTTEVAREQGSLDLGVC